MHTTTIAAPVLQGKIPHAATKIPEPQLRPGPAKQINKHLLKEKKFKLIAVSGRVWSRERLESRWLVRQRIS